MQVEVRLMILSDDGVLIMGATRIDFVVPGSDFEGNITKAAARLADLREDAEKSVNGQVRQMREAAQQQAGADPDRPAPER
jgi:hypothetical protein